MSTQALKIAREALEHDAPGSCWATGPLTGDYIEDLIVCPGCRAIATIDASLAQPQEAGQALTIKEAFEHVGGYWTGEDKLCPTFGSGMALKAYTIKMQRNAVDISKAASPAPDVRPSAPKFDEDEFERMVERGTQAWKGVPDTWLEDLRDVRPSALTDEEVWDIYKHATNKVRKTGNRKFAIALTREMIRLSTSPSVPAEERQEIDKYVRKLAMYMWRSHYREDSPEFELFESTAGVLSQIDNMLTGLVRKIESPALTDKQILALADNVGLPYTIGEPSDGDMHATWPDRVVEFAYTLLTFSTPASAPSDEHPLSGMYINQGSMDAAADAYAVEYEAAKEERFMALKHRKRELETEVSDLRNTLRARESEREKAQVDIKDQP